MSEENGQEPKPQEETPVKESGITDDAGKHDKLKSLPAEDLISHILELRAENAKHRTEKKSAEAELEEYRKWKDSQKTEAEKLVEENAVLKKIADEYQKDKDLRAAGKAAELDEDLWEFVKGNSPDEMLESAKRLAEKSKGRIPEDKDSAAAAKNNPFASLMAGRRGTPVTKEPKDPGGAFLRSLGDNS